MKKLIGVLLLSLASFANAGGIDCRSGIDHKHPLCYQNVHYQHRYHGHGHVQHNRHYHRNDWVLPAVTAGAITYILTRPVEPTVIYNTVPSNVVPIQQNCTEWREYYQNGVLIRERTCW
jgi:hypothetical protein